MILDILNEDERHANVAPLIEDFLEKTDLRVQYADLKRRRGGRVQVTSIIAPEFHKTKLEAIKLAEEFVFLSPLSLAEFVHSLKDHTNSISVTTFASTAFWACLDGKPTNISQLASELKRIMYRALTGKPDSPHGPMAKVPVPIRQLIRLFVENQASTSTNRLRERERADSSGHASNDVHSQTERRAEFLRAASAGDRLQGRVRNIVEYGAFIDLGCVDGLLHVSRIPGAVNGKIGEKLIEGEQIEVEILEVDADQQRISLRILLNNTVGNE